MCQFRIPEPDIASACKESSLALPAKRSSRPIQCLDKRVHSITSINQRLRQRVRLAL